MIALTPSRTRVLLRIRRLLTAEQRKNHPKWPEEAVAQAVNQDMTDINKLPMRKVRRIASGFGRQYT